MTKAEKNMNWVKKARLASGLSPEQCAVAIGRSRRSYDQREREPGLFKLDELFKLESVLTDDGKKIVWDFMQEFKA